MTKDMTPMKRYSANMQELRKQLKPFFSELTLNKSEPKYFYSGGESNYNSGVENDFILIFSNKAKHVSFALSFSYIDLPLDKQTVQASVKNGKSNDDIESSEVMTLDEFKNKINYFNKWLNENNAKHTKEGRLQFGIVDKFAEIFLDKTLDIKKEVEKKEKQIAEFIVEKSKELNIGYLAEVNQKADSTYSKAQISIKSKIESSPEFKELQLINKRAKELQQVLALREKKLEKDMDLHSLLEIKQEASLNLRQVKSVLEDSVETELGKSSKFIAKKVKPKY